MGPIFRVYALTDGHTRGRSPLMQSDSCANAVYWAFRTLRKWAIVNGDHVVCMFYGETENGASMFGELS